MGHQLGPAVLLQCNMGYMRCNVEVVKENMLRCIINWKVTFKLSLTLWATENSTLNFS